MSADIREQLIEATILELRSVSRDNFGPAQLCERLGISPSSVNYHFGSREGLLLEASVTAYERYGEGFRNLPVKPGESYRKNLFAHIDHQIAWTSENKVVTGIINTAADNAFSPDQYARISRVLYHNLIMLAAAILEAVDQVEHPAALSDAEIRQRPEIALATAMVGYMVHGRATWESGPFREHGAFELINETADRAGRSFMTIVNGVIDMCIAIGRPNTASA